MEKLNFYTVDISYVDYLKDAECKHRGFSRVPNMEYGDKRKPKFLVDELVSEIVETEQNEIQEQGTIDFGDNEDEKGGAE